MGPEAILLLVVAQGALSQTVSDFFSRLSIANYFEAQDQLEKSSPPCGQHSRQARRWGAIGDT